MSTDLSAGRLMVLRAAAMFDGVSSALMARPSVVVADGVIAAVHGPAGPVPADRRTTVKPLTAHAEHPDLCGLRPA